MPAAKSYKILNPGKSPLVFVIPGEGTTTKASHRIDTKTGTIVKEFTDVPCGDYTENLVAPAGAGRAPGELQVTEEQMEVILSNPVYKGWKDRGVFYTGAA